jgi:hypothetical protein
MGREYQIKCAVPKDADLAALLRKLPSPIHRNPMCEIYNYSVEADGFYFIDHLVDSVRASEAMRIFIDAGLATSESVEIVEI